MALTGQGCGHELRPGARFCTVCGRPAADADPPQAAAPEPTYPDWSPTITSLSAARQLDESASRPQWGPPERHALAVDSPFKPAYVAPAPYQPPAVEPGLYQPSPIDSGLHQPSRAAPGFYGAPGAPPVPPQFLPNRPGLRQGGPQRFRGLIVGVVAFLAAGGVAAAVLIAHPFHSAAADSGADRSASAVAGGTSSALASASSAPSTQQQAAQSLAGLLAQSVTDRSSIVAAVNDVNSCGPNLNQDPQTFQTAATSRQSLLIKLADLPGRSALPANMLVALTSAWQNSIKADQYYAQWAQDEISNGCTTNDQSDPNVRAAIGPDDQATTDKQAFVSLWNPIASQYGLPNYQWSQL